MDKRKQLYKLYKERGLISDAVSEDAFLSASQEQQEKLYYLGQKNGLFKETELSTFQSAWSPSKKKEDSNLQSDQGSTSSATQEAKDPMPLAYFQDYASKANRAIDSGKKTEYERIKIEMDAFLKKNADYFSSEEDVKKEYNDTSKRAANIFKVDKQPSFMDLVPQAFTPIERGLGPLKEDAIPKVYGEDKRSDEEVVSDVISESIDMRDEQGPLSLGISEALGREQSPLMQEEVSTEATTEFITPEQKKQARLLTPQQSMMGDVFEGTAIGDFSDDLYAAIKTGSAQKDVISPALALSLKGKESTDEEVLNFIKSYKALMNASSGRGFMDWQKTYEAGGGDLLAAIKATIAHPQGATEVLTTSLWAMLNKESLTAAGIAGGATTGAVATTGAPLPVAIGAGVKSAYAAGGAILEGTLAFAEFLNEEIVEKGKKLTLETVRDVLEDEKAMTRLRARAGGRAATIAAVDLIGMHVGGKIAKKAVKKGKKGVAVATATGTEIVSGSSGEALARVVAGQKMDAGDILLEGIAGPVGVPATLADVIINPPSYKMNGQKVSGPEMARVIEETDDSDFAKLDLEIKNDDELNAVAKQRKTKLKVKKSLMDIANREITDEELDEFILLSEEKRKLSNKKGSKSKERLAEVEEKIDNLYNKLESEDAVQEQSTDEVPVQPDAAVSEEVEEGVPETEPEVVTEEGKEIIVEDPNKGYQFEYESEDDIPSELSSLTPRSKGEVEIGRGKNKKKKITLIFSGQQLIDAGLAKSSEEQSTIEKTTTEETEEKIADIERRRQEELTDIGRANLIQAAYNAKSDRDSDPNSAFKEMTDEEIDSEFQKALNSLNDLLRGLRKKGVSNERITKAVINKIINHPILRMRRGGSDGIIKSIEKGLDSFLPSQEVNAKYDSELAALEEAATPEVEQEVSDLEAVIEEEARPIEERKPRIQAIEEEAAKVRKTASKKTFTAKQATQLKKELRDFINKTLPKAMWTTPEVKKILREVQNATIRKNYYKLVEKPKDDIREVMSRVIDLVNEKSSKISMAEVKSLMDVKTEKKEGGRMKGMFTAEGVDRINNFKEDMSLNEKSPLDEVDGKIDELNQEKTTLENKIDLTEDDLKRLEMINIALLYNSALNMDNKSQAKSKTLQEVARNIKIVLSGARSEFRKEQKQKHEYYKSLQKDAIEAISGQKVDLDSDESIKQFEENLSKKTNIKDNKPKIKKVLTSIGDSVDFIIKRMESLEGLLDRITTESTDIFGGKLSEIIDGRISESSRNYKQGRREMFETIRQNAERIYGKKYKKITRRNGINKYEIYTNKEEVDALKSKLEKTKDKKEKRKIADEIKSKTLRLTQNEMYYHYNQYKDLANHPGYESKKSWGENTPNIMKQINETLDPRVIEWADWQVNEFFPSVYDRYNAVYRELYKTNMPWNAQYAGRLMRETRANDVADADLFNQMSTAYQNNIGSQSTKARTKNNRAILDVNGDAVLLDYIDDMEYVRAYAETMRDISKIYNNNLVRDAIIATTSEDTYNVIFSQSVKKPGLIAKILNRDLSKSGSEGKLINTMTRNFVISRLGLNGTIFLKQFTSGLAFADYIGYRNWAAYASKNLAAGVGDAITFKNFNKTWKEMYKNSPELQDRYDTKDFSRVLETYTREASDELSGGIKMGRVMDAMMYLVKQGDKGGVMGSIPNYLYYKDQYKSKNPKKTEQDAIEFAIRKVERQIKSTQQDQDIQNKDFYQTGEWYQRWLSMFQSSPRALLRKEIIAIRNLYRKLNVFYEAEGGLKERMKVAGEAGKGTTKQNIRTFIQYHVVVPMFFQYMAMGLPGIFRDWDEEEDLEDLGIAAVLGNLNAIFALGDIFSSIKDFIKGNPWAGDARGLPVFEMFVTVADSLSKYKSAKREETKNKYAMKALTSAIDLTGVPASQINKIAKNFRIILDKEYNTYEDYREAVARFFTYGDYQLKTKKQREEERRKRMKKVKIPRISY